MLLGRVREGVLARTSSTVNSYGSRRNNYPRALSSSRKLSIRSSIMSMGVMGTPYLILRNSGPPGLAPLSTWGAGREGRSCKTPSLVKSYRFSHQGHNDTSKGPGPDTQSHLRQGAVRLAGCLGGSDLLARVYARLGRGLPRRKSTPERELPAELSMVYPESPSHLGKCLRPPEPILSGTLSAKGSSSVITDMVPWGSSSR